MTVCCLVSFFALFVSLMYVHVANVEPFSMIEFHVWRNINQFLLNWLTIIIDKLIYEKGERFPSRNHIYTNIAENLLIFNSVARLIW